MKRFWFYLLMMVVCGGSFAGHTHAYDLVGRLDYNYENRLIGVKAPAPDNTVLASYTYDALGHRVKQVKGGQTTRYYYDGETVLAEYNGSNQLQRSHIHGPTYVDEHVLLKQGGQEYYYLLGSLYSVTGLVNANGVAVERYRYDAYGKPTWLGFGNFNNDNRVDLRDFLIFQKSFSGNQPCSEAGRPRDYNADGRVDLQDYQAFAVTVTGTGQQTQPLSPYLFTGQPLDFQLTDSTTGHRILLRRKQAQQEDFQAFLRELRRRYRDRPVWLLLDRAGCRVAANFSDWQANDTVSKQVVEWCCKIAMEFPVRLTFAINKTRTSVIHTAGKNGLIESGSGTRDQPMRLQEKYI